MSLSLITAESNTVNRFRVPKSGEEETAGATTEYLAPLVRLTYMCQEALKIKA